MTGGAILHRTKSCGFCGKAFSRTDPNRGKKKYCGRDCYRAAEHAKGPARFWAKVDKGPHPKGCWLYTGFTKWDGYGWLARTIDGRATKHLTAHRYAWILTHGVPAKGEHILHDCDVAACCNPAHLRLGTHQENMNDLRDRGRRHCKLTPEAVREIRAAFATVKGKAPYGMNMCLAEKYGVKDKTIWEVRVGQNWSHIK